MDIMLYVALVISLDGFMFSLHVHFEDMNAD